MSGSPKPPLVDVVTIDYLFDEKGVQVATAHGKNIVGDGEDVLYTRVGKTEYFRGPKKFKVTWEPLFDDSTDNQNAGGHGGHGSGVDAGDAGPHEG